MRKKIYHIVLVAFMLFCGMAKLCAAPVVKAVLDSNTMIMGKMRVLQLMVEEPKDAKGHFPLFNQLRERGYATVCGDSVELRAPAKIDTVDMGSQRRIMFAIPVQSFDSGAYELPSIEYVVGRDTARSNRVALKVVPVSANAEDPIADYAGTADPEDPSFFDWVPDWVLDFWWLILLLLLLTGGVIYGIRRYKKNGSLLPKKPEPSPYEEATKNLRALKTQKLWEQGLEKEYYTELTDILRRYLYRRFGINAAEMTSRQILGALGKNPETKDKRSYFRKILDMADFVKFAKVRPLPEDNIASYDDAMRFVEETKPAPVPEAEDDAVTAVKKDKKSAKTKISKKKGGTK